MRTPISDTLAAGACTDAMVPAGPSPKSAPGGKAGTSNAPGSCCWHTVAGRQGRVAPPCCHALFPRQAFVGLCIQGRLPCRHRCTCPPPAAWRPGLTAATAYTSRDLTRAAKCPSTGAPIYGTHLAFACQTGLPRAATTLLKPSNVPGPVSGTPLPAPTFDKGPPLSV